MSLHIRYYQLIGQRGKSINGISRNTLLLSHSARINFVSTLLVTSSDPLISLSRHCWIPWNYHQFHKRGEDESLLACSPYDGVQRWSLPSRLLQAYRNATQFFQRWTQFLLDAFFVSLKTSEIALRCTPFMILIPASLLAPTQPISLNIQRASWKYALYTIQQLGPAFIKLFQWGATRRDLFPINICDELSHLHDNAHIHSWEQTHLILQREFGQHYSSTLRIEPCHYTRSDGVIGSGSAAQVYRAKLKDDHTGTDRLVAVKILHPGVRESMERDLMFMKRIAFLLGTFAIYIDIYINLQTHTHTCVRLTDPSGSIPPTYITTLFDFLQIRFRFKPFKC